LLYWRITEKFLLHSLVRCFASWTNMSHVMFCSYTWHLTHQTAVQMRMEVGHTGQWKIIIGVPDLVHRGCIMPDLPLQPFLEQCFTGGVLSDSAGSYSTTAQHNSVNSYHTSIFQLPWIALCFFTHTLVLALTYFIVYYHHLQGASPQPHFLQNTSDAYAHLLVVCQRCFLTSIYLMNLLIN